MLFIMDQQVIKNKSSIPFFQARNCQILILILALQIPLTPVPLRFLCNPNFCLFPSAADGPVFFCGA